MTDKDKVIRCKFNSIEEQKLYDIQAKMNIAKYVVTECLSNEDTTYSGVLKNKFFKEALNYFPNNVLNVLLTKAYVVNNNPKTFLDWNAHMFMSSQHTAYDVSIDKLMRDIILDHYVIKKSLPTKESIIAKFKTKKTWNRKDIELCWKLRGFKWKRLPRSSKAILIEEPEQSFARMKYLHSIEQFRNAGSHIVYIEEKMANKEGCFVNKLKPRDVDITLIYLAVSSSLGIISKNITYVMPNDMLLPHDNTFPLITNWILDTVVPQLSIPSVFVLEDILDNQKTFEDVPTMYSSKNDMLNWLELNDVPHSSSMHSAELFELVKRSNRNFSKRKHFLDEKLMAYGHKVLRRPNKTQYLNYYNLIWSRVHNRFDESGVRLLSTITIDNCIYMENTLHEIEQKTLEEDMAVNKAIQKIFAFAKYEKIPYEDIQDCDEEIDELKMAVIVPSLEP